MKKELKILIKSKRKRELENTSDRSKEKKENKARQQERKKDSNQTFIWKQSRDKGGGGMLSIIW